MPKALYYQAHKIKKELKSYLSDISALLIILGVFCILAAAAREMHTPYSIGAASPISLSLSALPGYAANTVLRMFIALFFSLVFTFMIAPLAAKNRQAEKVILPFIDILQSIPILGMLSITVVGFIQLFPNSRLGPESAAIFAIFTSQVWNMTLSLYQSLKTTPKEFYETAAVFHLSKWQQFWRIEVPYAIPGLLWNTMISLSAGWFFVVASEAISVSNQNIRLPGIGSYISLAIAEANLEAILYSIGTMLMVIIAYDQLLFRPLLTWAARFNAGFLEEEAPERAWFYELLIKTRILKHCERFLDGLKEILVNTPAPRRLSIPTASFSFPRSKFAIWGWNTFLVLSILISLLFLGSFISKTLSFSEIGHVFLLGSITALKVILLILLASLIWVPVGVWIGLHPKTGRFIQPLTQFLAAFPINLVYPLAVTGILHFDLDVEIWSTPLMILGTQWYILFNVIAGTTAIPKELHWVSQNLSVRRWLWWKRLALPAIFPYYITGCMTAAAGCWNASIVADVLEWGDHKLIATGLGSYISEYTTDGDFPRILLGISIMCLYILVFNHFVWKRLYQFAASRFILE